MEAVPRLPMISFQLKVSPEPTAFGPKLKQYIRDFYNEDPESYSNEIHQLENLRATAVRPQIAVTGCSLLQKYYCQLHFLQSRFPMGADEGAAVTFTWKDTYANMVCSLANIRFEIMSILYNIGAVHTQLGARTERTTAEGMKMACSHFQWAAWAFEHLQSNSNLSGLDLAPELMTFMHQLSLAQAQECILEKSMLDNRKPTIVAKVAKQIVDYYSQALGTLEPNSSEDNAVSDTVGSKIYKNWKRYVKFKRAYHLAVTQLYQGLAAEEQQKMGERVAFYNASLAALNDARSMYASAKGAMGITGVAGEKEAIEEALTFTNDVIEGKRKAAKNENEFIYHEEVPEKDVLPTVNGASLVKGIPFSVNDPEVSGPDIFARLVPMKVHEASSLYSEEKAKILRSIGAKIDERDQHLEAYLASLKLQHLSLWDPDAQTPESEFLPLPEELAERCAALNARPTAIQDLVDVMGKLSDTYRDVESMLKEIDTLLAEEEQREKRYQEAMGKRPPTIVATDLTREAKKYEEAHAKASESNQALHRAMTLHVNNLQVLAQPLADLTANIPSPSANPSGQKTDSETDKANARELKRILGKVDEMQRQRNDLHAKLRDSIAQDDLTRLLVTATAESSSLETLFAEQISKHHALVGLIEQNLSAQDNILAALTDAYARTADTRKAVEEILKRRELTISSLITSYDAYEDLLAKSTKGLEFYRKLEVNVTKLLQRVKSTCKVQEEEREQILARNDKAAYGAAEAPAAPPTTERKPGSGMKLRDHLAARLKNNNPASYQQGHYGADRASIPVAPVQPNSHGTGKTYPLDSSGNDAPGIPVHAVPPVAIDNAAQQMYQQYYPNDYANYYMAQQQQQQQQQQQPQYPPHQYQYGENASLTNGGGTLSFPKTGTTNTDSMYRQASGHAIGTEVSSTSSRYAGYNSSSRGEQVSASPVPQPQYPVAGHAAYDNADYGAQYPVDYRSMQDSHGYQPQTAMSGASAGSTGGYQPQSSMPGASAGSAGGYQPQSSMPGASSGSAGGYQPQSSMPGASSGSAGGYQPQSSMPGASSGSAGGYQPQSSMPGASSGSAGGYQQQSSMPGASAGSFGGYQPQSGMPGVSSGSAGGYQPQSSMPGASAGSVGGYQPQSSMSGASSGSSGAYHSASVQPGYNHTVNLPADPASNLPVNQSPSHVQQPGQTVSSVNAYRGDEGTQPQQQQHQPHGQQTYDAGQNYANPYQVAPQPQPQMPQPTGSPATHGYSALPTANSQSNQHLSHVPPSNSPYAINDQYTQQQQQSATMPVDSSSHASMYPTSGAGVTGQTAISGVYYGNASQVPSTASISGDFAAASQQNYGEHGNAQSLHSAVTSTQPVPSYSSAYATYQPEIPSHVGSSAGYTNSAEMIQSHTKLTSNQGYLHSYQYPVQGHNSGVIQYPNYSQGYGNSYSQAPPTAQSSMTDSYKGHPGYAYDPTSGAYSYSSGYQDSQNGTAEGSAANAPFTLPTDGRGVQPVYGQQDNVSKYTNASNGTATSLTPSSQYSNGSYQTPSADHNYYTTAYGAQSQNEASTASNNNSAVSNAQTYQQGSNETTKSTTSTQPEAVVKPADKSQAPKSNLDLLAELDITINHAPLVPEVHSVDKTQKDPTVPLTALPEKIETRKNSIDIVQHVEDKHENLQIVWDTWYTDVQPKRDPLGDPIALQKFLADIEKYEKFVESLTVKTLSGSTNLDIKWSEISDVEEREMKRQTSYVAQAHASTNRTPNLVPYDSTRVRLSASNLSSDYINASHVNDLTQWTPAAFIVAQAPKPESYEAFWTMIWEQGSEVIACLATDAQLNDEIYWPTSKENNLTIGSFTLSLKNSTNHTSYVQRVISMMHSERRIERIVVHMQYLVWPSTGLPSSPGSLLSFATDILSEQALRHCSPKPIVVHCLLGGSLSGLFLLAAAAVCNVRAGQGAVNVPLVLSTLVKYRRCMMDRDSLLFGYRMVLYHAQDTLMKRGILSSTRSTFECFESMKGNKARAMKKPHHPSDDFLHNLGVGIQHSIARQQEHSIGQTGSQTKTEMVSQKTDKIDPLSQLDPLWSIRR